MFAKNTDRHSGFKCKDDDTVPHIARIVLNEIGAHIACGGKPRAIIKNAPSARIGSVPSYLAKALGMRINLMVNCDITIAIYGHAINHARVRRQQRFLNGWEDFFESFEKSCSELLRVGALNRHILIIE